MSDMRFFLLLVHGRGEGCFSYFRGKGFGVIIVSSLLVITYTNNINKSFFKTKQSFPNFWSPSLFLGDYVLEVSGDTPSQFIETGE